MRRYYNRWIFIIHSISRKVLENSRKSFSYFTLSLHVDCLTILTSPVEIQSDNLYQPFWSDDDELILQSLNCLRFWYQRVMLTNIVHVIDWSFQSKNRTNSITVYPHWSFDLDWTCLVQHYENISILLHKNKFLDWLELFLLFFTLTRYDAKCNNEILCDSWIAFSYDL